MKNKMIIDKTYWKKFHKDCESICFDCGKPNPRHKIDDGVKLCTICKIKDLIEKRFYNKFEEKGGANAKQ